MAFQMRDLWRTSTIAGMAILLATVASAQEAAWRVGKSSGDVWFGSSAQQVSLAPEASLPAGETVRTGKNGRVLLTRGEETILVGPNSEIALPAEAQDGKTTILQRAGSILLEVEKKNVPHFEVMTPYLAAVVKGTQFSVSVDGGGARVDVTRGQVEVADYKSGQFAVVLPGQAANVGRGIAGLSLTGSGSFNAIQRGEPRIPPVKLMPVPKGGFAGPPGPRPQLQERQAAAGASGGAPTVSTPAVNGAADQARVSATKITAPLGEVRMNVHAVTGGLARDASPPPSAKSSAGKDTVWSAPESKSSGTATANTARSNNGAVGGNSGNSGNGNGVSAMANANSSGNGGSATAPGRLGGPSAPGLDTGHKNKIGRQNDDDRRSIGRRDDDDRGPRGRDVGRDHGRGPGRR